MPNPADGSVVAAWVIAGLATAGVIVRPFRLPEAIWAVAGAVALVAFGLLPWMDALAGVRKGLDVYLFLAGMMLIAEMARQEGVFDWLAALAVEHARGSPQRLFTLVYAVGTAVTVLLSNDATTIVLTPAVYAATRAAGIEHLFFVFAVTDPGERQRSRITRYGNLAYGKGSFPDAPERPLGDEFDAWLAPRVRAALESYRRLPPPSQA